MAESVVKTLEQQADTPWYDSHWLSALGGGLASLGGKSALSYLSKLLPTIAGYAAPAVSVATPAVAGLVYGLSKGKSLDDSGETKRMVAEFNQLRDAGFMPREDGTVVDEDGEVVPEKYVQMALNARKASQAPVATATEPVSISGVGVGASSPSTATDASDQAIYEEYLNELDKLEALMKK